METLNNSLIDDDKNLNHLRKEFKEKTDELKEVYKFNLAESKSNHY